MKSFHNLRISQSKAPQQMECMFPQIECKSQAKSTKKGKRIICRFNYHNNWIDMARNLVSASYPTVAENKHLASFEEIDILQSSRGLRLLF